MPFSSVPKFKIFKVFVTARKDGFMELADGGAQGVVGLAIEHKKFPDPIQRHDAPDRRRGGRAKQPVISARVATNHSRSGVTAKAVGEQPFKAEVGIQFTVSLNGVGSHAGSVTGARRRAMKGARF